MIGISRGLKSDGYSCYWRKINILWASLSRTCWRNWRMSWTWRGYMEVNMYNRDNCKQELIEGLDSTYGMNRLKHTIFTNYRLYNVNCNYIYLAHFITCHPVYSIIKIILPESNASNLLINRHNWWDISLLTCTPNTQPYSRVRVVDKHKVIVYWGIMKGGRQWVEGPIDEKSSRFDKKKRNN